MGVDLILLSLLQAENALHGVNSLLHAFNPL